MNGDLGRNGQPAGRTRLSGLTAYLYGLVAERVVVSFDELEQMTGCRLNQTLRRNQSAWSVSSHYARYWRDTGYRASFRDVPPDHIAFVRED
jgi:hypothetical protein